MTQSRKPTGFRYASDRMTVASALRLARGEMAGVLDARVIARVKKSADAVKTIVASGRTVYGINTGFGPLCTTVISPSDTEKLQYNILRSHSVGVGDAIPLETAALMLVLKIHALALGYSGIRLETIERILWHVETGLIPLVPEQGSVGASGDLAPLAHLFLPLIGLGQVWHGGRFRDARAVLRKFGKKPLTLGPKEGLALINGTQFIAAFATQAAADLKNCLDAADIIGALTLESLLGSVKPFDEGLHALRPFRGALLTARRLRNFLKGSELVVSHERCPRVQDPYSLRCMPQVHGASRDAWLHFKESLTCELNAVTDNPVIFDSGDTVSGGNFHGQPLALPVDYATLAASEIGNISDRRTYLMLEGKVEGLPQLLMRDTGINSGFMIPQYASAALASENKGLCFPASADSIPTSLGQEDHVSMGSIGARKLCRVIGNVENILAVELLCAAQAFDFRRPLKSGPVLEAVHDAIRTVIPHAEEDRVFSDDIRKARDFIATGRLCAVAEDAAKTSRIDLNGDFDDLFGLH
jgi:histidine ammonia-lyase